MRSPNYILLVSLGLILIAVVLGVVSWRAIRHANVIVEWTTASELDMAGFNLYRSNFPEGPFEQVNEGLIPPSIDPLTGGSYSFSDELVEAGKIYYYQLEAVETGGTIEQFGPIELRASSAGKLGLGLAIILATVGITMTIKLKTLAKSAKGG